MSERNGQRAGYGELQKKCDMDFDSNKVIKLFFFSDHFLIGPSHAKTSVQIQRALGDKNPLDESFEGYYRRQRTHACIVAARNRLGKLEPPRFLYSKKIKNRPTIYYLVNPASEEFVDLFERKYKTFRSQAKRLHSRQVLIQQTLPKVKNPKIKALLEKEYSKRIAE